MEKWDVIVIGAGMAGVLTAHLLNEHGMRVLVLEAKTVASGQTGRTTAKITSQHDMKYAEMIKTLGRKRAGLYARANEAAIKEYERLITKEKIDCEYERTEAYLYTISDPVKLKKEAEEAVSLGIDAQFTTDTELPFPVTGAVCFRGQAQFDAQRFIRQLASQLELREYTKVVKIRGERVYAECMSQDGKKVEKRRVYCAEHVIVATHYPVFNVPGFYFLRQHQERSYVLALTGIFDGQADAVCAKPMRGMYYGVDKGSHSFRRIGDILLLGGGSHRTGEHTCGGAYDALVRASERYFPKENYPEKKEVARWSAQDCMPHDGVPFIGKYSWFTPHHYVITGFQKWGMTTSMVAAMILRDTLCGVETPYAKLFSPQRMYVCAGISAFLKDIGVSVKELARGMLQLPKSPARCPHLGCELKWNPDEHSWDCPCHGSRFDENGELLDNPAKKGLAGL